MGYNLIKTCYGKEFNIIIFEIDFSGIISISTDDSQSLKLCTEMKDALQKEHDKLVNQDVDKNQDPMKQAKNAINFADDLIDKAHKAIYPPAEAAADISEAAPPKPRR